jgi:uncharacterized membrane protein YhiD involved in acid resistance
MELGEFVVRVAAALLLGAAIGVERQWHHRRAGLRTNTLAGSGFVAAAAIATALVIAANVVLRPLGQLVDRQPAGHADVTAVSWEVSGEAHGE